MSTLEVVKAAAYEGLAKAAEFRKDDAQGLQVKVQLGDAIVELLVTAKPSSGSAWRGGAAAGADQEHTEEEVIAIIKKFPTIPAKDWKVWTELGFVCVTSPYGAAGTPAGDLSKELNEAGVRWVAAEKIRKCKLKAAPAPS